MNQTSFPNNGNGNGHANPDGGAAYAKPEPATRSLTRFSFENVELVESCSVNGTPHFTRRAIGELLGYADPQKAIDKIIERNPHIQEFSIPVKLGGVHRDYETTVLSPIGLSMIIFESGTESAIRFKVWAAHLIEAYRTGNLKATRLGRPPSPTRWTKNRHHHGVEGRKVIGEPVWVAGPFGDSLAAILLEGVPYIAVNGLAPVFNLRQAQGGLISERHSYLTALHDGRVVRCTVDGRQMNYIHPTVMGDLAVSSRSLSMDDRQAIIDWSMRLLDGEVKYCDPPSVAAPRLNGAQRPELTDILVAFLGQQMEMTKMLMTMVGRNS
jgi:hypothetical protein